jgi:hypothetical protein
MTPGVFMFRMTSGLWKIASDTQTTFEVARATMFDGLTAAMFILVMSFGLIVPKLVVDYANVWDRQGYRHRAPCQDWRTIRTRKVNLFPRERMLPEARYRL